MPERNHTQRAKVWPEPRPGASPTFLSYNASAVKIYSVTSSLVHFENNFFYVEKML
jgi:hypothetical protein